MASSQPTSVPISEQSQVEYRHIPAFLGYRAGDDGTVWSRWERGGAGRSWKLGDSWRQLNPGRERTGYLHVTLHAQGKRVLKSVHRLILEVFRGPCPPGHECRHFPDNDRTNNRLENLCWGTRIENIADREIHGTTARGDRSGSRLHPERLARGDRNGSRLHPESRPRGDRSGPRLHPERMARGEQHGLAKLTETEVRAIRRLYATGQHSQAQLAELFQVTKTSIRHIVKHRTWKHVL